MGMGSAAVGYRVGMIWRVLDSFVQTRLTSINLSSSADTQVTLGYTMCTVIDGGPDDVSCRVSVKSTL